MQDVAVRRTLAGQVGAGQAVQEYGGRGVVGAGKGGRRPRADGRPGDQAQQPEQPSGGGRQGRVGAFEGNPHRGVGILSGLQRPQPVAGGELGGVGGDGGARAVGQVGRGDSQRQRQVAAQPGELGG